MKPTARVEQQQEARDIMPLRFDVTGLEARIDEGNRYLVLHLPVYHARGPILNQEEAERMRRNLDLSERDIEDGLEHFFDYVVGVQVGRMLGKRRIKE